MRTLDGVKVISSGHACDQAMRRVGRLAGASRNEATRWVELSVAQALIAGRRSKTMPRWCSAGKHEHILYRRKKLNHPGLYRFVWDEGRSAVFAVVRAHEKERFEGAAWVVITVMVPRVPLVKRAA